MAKPALTPPAPVANRKRSARRERAQFTIVVDHLDPSSVNQLELDVLETYLGAWLDEILRKMRK